MKFTTTGKSLVELHDIYGEGNDGFYSSWWENEPFANDKPEAGTYEIDLKNTSKFFNLTFAEQKEKLPKGFDFPHPAILAEAILKHYAKTGRRLLENCWSRCSSVGSDGNRVDVGDFGSGGLHVNGCWDDLRDSLIGLSSARKLKSLNAGKIETFENLNLETRIKKLEEFRENVERVLKL